MIHFEHLSGTTKPQPHLHRTFDMDANNPQKIMTQTFPLFTIDTLIKLLTTAVFAPVPALLLPLTHLSISPTSYTHPSPAFQSFLLFYTLPILFIHLYLYLDNLFAYSKWGYYGPPRKIDWKSEVVVITGGAGGLGRSLAEIFASRGVPVAVLDVKGEEEEKRGVWEEMGVRWYFCDVGDRGMVERVAARIGEEVCDFSSSFFGVLREGLGVRS